MNVYFESMVTKHREQILRYTQEDLLGKSKYNTQRSLIERCACLCNARCVNLVLHVVLINLFTVLPAKSDSDVKFCLQSYQGLRIDRSLVY